MRKIGVNLALIVIGFVLGIYVDNRLPSTFFTHPVLTYRMMHEYPIDSYVVHKDTEEARELFAKVGWDGDPALIVAYEVIMMRGEEYLICQVRPRRGRGNIIAVSPSWFDDPVSR